jgi:hypothetical protein
MKLQPRSDFEILLKPKFFSTLSTFTEKNCDGFHYGLFLIEVLKLLKT